MNVNQASAFSGVWSVAWRSVVYLPLMLLAFGGQLALGVGLVTLPVISSACICCEQYTKGFSLLASWAVLLWAWRHFRLIRFYMDSSSDL